MTKKTKKPSLSQKYEASIRKRRKSTPDEINRYGVPYISYIPEAKNYNEAFERLVKLTGQRYFESLQRKVLNDYHELTIPILESELKSLNDFISQTTELSIKDALGNLTNLSDGSEYLRIVNGYYKNNWCNSAFGCQIARIYGTYILLSEWLNSELQKLTEDNTTSKTGMQPDVNKNILRVLVLKDIYQDKAVSNRMPPESDLLTRGKNYRPTTTGKYYSEKYSDYFQSRIKNPVTGGERYQRINSSKRHWENLLNDCTKSHGMLESVKASTIALDDIKAIESILSKIQ